jgi:Winged helix DNA-binding domain
MGSATWHEVRARRLARSSLVERVRADRLVEIAHRLGGVHAQVQASAELQLAARIDGITQADVRDALWERRSLVKAWTLRRTLHLHPADELALWYAAQRAVARTSSDGADELEAWRDPAGVLHPPLGHDDVNAIRAAVRDALDGRCMLREELAEEVVKRVGPAPRERLLSGFAFFLDELCQGPPQGTKVTFVRPDQWIDGWQEVDEQGALLEVCRRYLHTYGPARATDFREWFGGRALELAHARALFDSLGDELVEIDVEGHRAHVLAGDTDFPSLQPSLRLLPEYDVYIMGFREREHLVPDAVKEQLAAHPRGRYEGPAGVRFVIVDGVPAGLWERKKRGRRLELQVAPTRRLTKAQRAELDAEAERIGAFVGLEPVVTVA